MCWRWLSFWFRSSLCTGRFTGCEFDRAGRSSSKAKSLTQRDTGRYTEGYRAGRIIYAIWVCPGWRFVLSPRAGGVLAPKRLIAEGAENAEKPTLPEPPGGIVGLFSSGLSSCL